VVCAKDIILKPFFVNLEDQLEYEESIERNVDERKMKLVSFYSTPAFIQTLTEISKELT
jgi:hypothetical protein